MAYSLQETCTRKSCARKHDTC